MMIDIYRLEANGRTYEFEVYPKETKFNNIVAIYAFLAPTLGGYYLLYIGKTTELGNRLENHHKWHEALRNGFEYVGVCRDVTLLSLDLDERALIQRHRPPLNEALVQ